MLFLVDENKAVFADNLVLILDGVQYVNRPFLLPSFACLEPFISNEFTSRTNAKVLL